MAVTIAATLVALAGLTGCGGSSRKKDQKTTSTRARTTTRAQVRLPIATVQDVGDGGSGPEPMVVSIYDLRRNGPFVTLDFGIRCENPSTGCDAGTLFAFVTLREENTAATIKTYGNTAGGVMLIDPSSEQEYGAVSDSDGRPYASSVPFHISDSMVHLAWVTFRAPPQSVTNLSAAFPMGGPLVAELPISAGPAPSASELGSKNVIPATAAPFAQLPGSTSTAGLTLPVENLISTVGNASGSDAESDNQATITLRADVLFRFGKSNLTTRARAVLAQVADRINARAMGAVLIDGYTDSIGTDQVNIPLSHARAATVVAALKPLTARTPVTFQADGFGSSDPVAPNTLSSGADNPAGRALNRRVTITFKVKRPAAPAPLATGPTPQSSSGNASTATFTAPHTSGGADVYRVTANNLYRDGAGVVLELTITCETPAGAQQSSGGTCSGADFAGTPTIPPVPASQQFSFQTQGDTASAIYLTDPSTGTQYIPLRDEGGVALTASVNPSIKPGDSYPLWLAYPAPPATASSETVVLPGAGALIGPVPIASHPPRS